MIKREQFWVSIPDRRCHKEERRKEDQSEPAPTSPHSIKAEESLIGALLLDNTRLADVLQIADDSHIYRDDHRRIFQHIVRIIESGDRADIVTVSESIERSNEIEQTGGLVYLGEIADSTPSAANVISYAKIVRERFITRKLAECGERITALAMMPGGMRLAEQMQSAQEAWKAVSALYRDYTYHEKSSSSKTVGSN